MSRRHTRRLTWAIWLKSAKPSVLPKEPLPNGSTAPKWPVGSVSGHSGAGRSSWARTCAHKLTPNLSPADFAARRPRPGHQLPQKAAAHQ